jgi:hypothetical protein
MRISLAPRTAMSGDSWSTSVTKSSETECRLPGLGVEIGIQSVACKAAGK